MRESRIIQVVLVVCSIIAFVWFLPNLFNPEYFGMRHKGAKWYADFTAACDSVLAEHPVGTNDAVWIPVTDPSLPKIITDLHPLKLQVNSQRVWMLMVSDSHAGFALEWHPKWEDTNVWILETIAEGLETILYSSNRSVLPNDRAKRTAGSCSAHRQIGSQRRQPPIAHPDC